MKQRFSSLDVKAIARELSSELCTLRLSNIYDLSSRIFLLKFQKPDCRRSLLVDVGFRCHLTDFVRTTASAPSSFVVRMRKFLRSRRVTSVAQVGTDRIIEVQLSDGQFYLFLEFYAGGNIILTNQDLIIISLFRMVPEGTNQEELRIGSKYSLDNRLNNHGLPPLTVERVKMRLQEVLDKSLSGNSAFLPKTKSKPVYALRKALTVAFSEFSPVLLDHAFQVACFDSATPVEDVVGNNGTLCELLHALKEAQRINESITAPGVIKGYIIAKPQRINRTQSDKEQVQTSLESQKENLIYEEFHPFRPRQYEKDDSVLRILEFDGFNKTVDEFFSSIESQKLESRIEEREGHAKKKLENAKQDHERRLGGLQKVQELNVRKAQAIEAHLQEVQEATSAVNSLVAQGIGWPEIAQLIEIEQQRNNPVAGMIQLPLKLHENTVTLLLTEAGFEDEADFEGDETDSDVSDSQDVDSNHPNIKSATARGHEALAVDVDLELSPWSNARQYYDLKKTAAEKEQRTIQSSAKALKNTERKINADLKKGLTQEKEVLRPQRSPYWFEKFLYFISSEGYLVLGGKDVQQCDIIYKKYLTKGDVYVYADLQGAASVVIKNKPGHSYEPIPPSTLSQAGNLAICSSSAWDSKAIMSAWWVHADQVSKMSQVDEFLPPGIFAIKGEKNFLPPAQLLLGIGLLFKISEDSKMRHFKHRITTDTETSSKAILEPGHSSDSKDLELSDTSDNLGKINQNSELQNLDTEKSEPEDQRLGHPLTTHGGEDSSQEGSDANYDNYNPLQSNGPHHDALIQALPNASSGYPDDSESIDEGETDAADTAEVKDSAFVQNGAENAVDAVRESTQNKVRHVPAPERRNLRKEQRPVESKENADSLTRVTPNSQTNTASQEGMKADPISQPQVRGKKGKRYKLKTKYADQDEEERALAMRLLGSISAQQKARDEVEANTSKEQKQAAERERRRKQQNLIAQKGKEDEEKRRRTFQEELEVVEDGEPEIMEDLEAFVGVPLPGDEIIDVLIVCGPWDAVGSRCRWKAKLQPGSVKKGKAVKEVLSAWNASSKAWDKKKQPSRGDNVELTVEEENVRKREAELIQAVREPEIVGVVPVGKARVMMSAVEGSSKARGGGIAGRGRRGGRGSKKK